MDRRTSLSMLGAGLAAAGTSSPASAQTTGGIKFMVLYGHPPGAECFRQLPAAISTRSR